MYHKTNEGLGLTIDHKANRLPNGKLTSRTYLNSAQRKVVSLSYKMLPDLTSY